MTAAAGMVKWFNPQKGFGFITPDDGGEDLFVHQSAIYGQGFRTLSENERVEFQVTEDRGRLKATHITSPGGGFVAGDAGAGSHGGPGVPSPAKWPVGVVRSDGEPDIGLSEYRPAQRRQTVGPTTPP